MRQPDRCPVCLDSVVRESHGSARFLGCAHWGHFECLKTWGRHQLTCPVCAREDDVLVRWDGTATRKFSTLVQLAPPATSAQLGETEGSSGSEWAAPSSLSEPGSESGDPQAPPPAPAQGSGVEERKERRLAQERQAREDAARVGASALSEHKGSKCSACGKKLKTREGVEDKASLEHHLLVGGCDGPALATPPAVQVRKQRRRVFSLLVLVKRIGPKNQRKTLFFQKNEKKQQTKWNIDNFPFPSFLPSSFSPVGGDEPPAPRRVPTCVAKRRPRQGHAAQGRAEPRLVRDTQREEDACADVALEGLEPREVVRGLRRPAPCVPVG